MYAQYECINCVCDHAQKLIDKLSKELEYSEKESFEKYKEIVKHLSQKSEYGMKPIELSSIIYDKFYEFSEEKDFFENEKTNANQMFLEMYEDLVDFCFSTEDPVRTAFKLSAFSNLLDFGIKNYFGELEWEIENLTKSRDFAIDDYNKFEEKIEKANKLLFIHDNAGEIVLDKILIKVLKNKYPNLVIHSAVRSRPIINDATMKDIVEVNMKEVSIPLESGSIYPGTILEKTNVDFKNIFESSDIVISKGQGNYEGMDDDYNKVFFILTTKCKSIAKNLNVEIGELVFKLK
ncbi:MAG: damage-control phosphatase ARMT1 family protein [Thermotogota bacterium]